MDRALFSVASFWQRFTITRYLVASVVALAVDMSVFASLVAKGTDPTAASAVGYGTGVVVHWLISARYVFIGKTRSGKELIVQRALFAGSALLGLAITVITVEILGRLSVNPVSAKIAAVGISFLAVYVMRKWGIFR